MTNILTITDLSKAFIPGLFALINESDKKLEIRYSSCIASSIAALLKQIKQGSIRPIDIKIDYDAGKSKFYIIETFNDSRLRYFKKTHHILECEKNGYKVYSARKVSGYKIKIEAIRYLAFVTLYNNNYEKTVLGVFDKIKEARAFLTEYYSDTPDEIIIANNEFTKAYYKDPIEFLSK